MQMDFHYYATYCAAKLAGWSHEDSLAIAYSAQFVDCCSRTLLSGLKAPLSAATTQLQLELMNARTDLVGLQDITRIWASFHFLPGDLYAPVKRASRLYKDKVRLICGPNGALLKDTVEAARGGSLQAAGIAMHVLADTWAHRYFAGTPSLVVNNTGSIFQNSENSIMNLGHGRAGHLPDYSFIRYRYLPAWGGYEEIVKDNPADYHCAFCQMIYALRYLRGDVPVFETGCYDTQTAAPWDAAIRRILEKRQPDACADWKALGEAISGREIEDFELTRYQEEYRQASDAEKDDTFLGRFFLAALAQKSMVTNKIFMSGNLLAGFSVDYGKKGFRGIRDFVKLVEAQRGGNAHE